MKTFALGLAGFVLCAGVVAVYSGLALLDLRELDDAPISELPRLTVVCDGKGIYSWTDETGEPFIFYDSQERAQAALDDYKHRQGVWQQFRQRVIDEVEQGKAMQWQPCQ